MDKGEVTSFIKFDEFQPETYLIDFVADLVKFLNSPTEGLWLIKKANSNQGRGIKLINDVKAYKEDLLTKKDEGDDSTSLFLEKIEKEEGDSAVAELA